MSETLNNESIKQEEQQSVFNLKTVWVLAYLNWYWIVISIVFFMSLSYIYLRYARPVYSASMKMLVKDSSSKRSRGNVMNVEELGIVSNSNGFDNELEIIKSGSVSTRVVKSLKLYVSYEMEGRVIDQELYKSSPILADMQENRLDALTSPVNIVVKPKGKGKSYRVELTMMAKKDDEESTKKVEINREIDKFPAHIKTPLGTVTLLQNPGFKMSDRELYISIRSPRQVGLRFASMLSVAPSSKTTTVAQVKLEDSQPQRILDYLSCLVDAYNDDANEDKNEVARKTEEFIRERIEIIRTELDDTEGDVETYKRNNNLINLSANAGSDLAGSTQYQKEQVNLQTQLMLFKSLIDYMANPANHLQVIPANLGLENQHVSQQIAEYNKLVMQRNRLLKESSETNPIVVHVTDQCDDLWPVIQNSLANIYHGMLTQKQSIDQQYNLYQGRNYQAPGQERALTNLGRQQEIKSGLYLTLLQKREENYISLASTAAKARIIDQPLSAPKIGPDSKKVMAVALVLGFSFPIGILYLLSLLRYRIEGHEDVQRLSHLEILADIPFTRSLDKNSRAIVVHENRNNMMEETFRGLRTNLGFIMQPGDKVIMATSCIPGEGKTFVSTNLAMSLALLGKKVIIVGLDIRKPQLVKLFGLDSDKRGISTYLVSPEPDLKLLEEQITHGVLNKNMDVLPAGIIPPNPAELISRNTLDEAINHLKTIYDYIIIDTPPVGLVSDSLSIGRVADVTLVVCRADYSPKANFELINNIDRQKKLPRMNLVLNSVDLEKKKYGYYYGYGKYGRRGYGYGKYSYGYGRYGHYGVYGTYGKASSDGKVSAEK